MRHSTTIIFPANRPLWIDPAPGRLNWAPMMFGRCGYTGWPSTQNWSHTRKSGCTWWRW